MVDKGEQAEPTMEEILASIRRIISEENSAEDSASQTAVAPVAEAPKANGKPQQKPEIKVEPAFEAGAEAPEEDDVLELTEMVGEEEKPDQPLAADDFDVEIEAEAPAHFDLEPEPAAAPASAEDMSFEEEVAENISARLDAKITDWEVPIDPADEDDAIMSDSASEETRSAFQNLSDLLVAGYQGSDNTLEAMVRTMLKPMLKSWLDENLPDIVERVVAREVARLARSKRP
jgi:cell pole-organizing protein PopZ